MSVSASVNAWRAVEACTRNYVAAEQWVATCRVTRNQRHLDTAHTCRAIADELYSQFTDQHLDGDEALARQICSESRKRVSETFPALAGASRALGECEAADALA